MKITKIYISIILLLLSSCTTYIENKAKIEQSRTYYSSGGFALIYDETLYKNKTVKNKLNNKAFLVLHSSLKRNTPIRISNPVNSKFVDTKIYSNTDYPQVFSLLITKKVAKVLALDPKNPFVEIFELKKNKTFIAKEGSIFEEEKNVANKVPVDEIKMKDLAKDKDNKNTKTKEQKEFVLVVSDFYYKESALNLKNELYSKIKLNNIMIKKINDNKYRLLIGPFKNFNALKNTYISLNNLGFEELNIYKE